MISEWVPSFITGQLATKRIRSYVIWRLEGGVCCHMWGVGWGSENTAYVSTEAEIWKHICLHRVEMFNFHTVLLLERVSLSKNRTDFVSQTLRRCRGSWRALTYVSGPGRHGSPPLSDKLVGVKTNLNDVVEQSQERSQRERRYEDGGEAKLENCREKNRLDELQRIIVSTLANTTFTVIIFFFFSFPLETNKIFQKGKKIHPFRGIHPPIHGRSWAADSSLCPTVEAGLYSPHSALHHLLSSSSCETTSSAAN